MRTLGICLLLCAAAGAPFGGARASTPLVEDSVSGVSARDRVIGEWRLSAAESMISSGLAHLGETLCRRVLEGSPRPETRARARISLALSLIHQRRFQEAKETLEAVPESARGARFHLCRAAARYGNGKTVDEEAFAADLEAIDPAALSREARPWHAFLRGLRADLEGDRTAAREAFSRALKRSRGSQRLLFEALVWREKLFREGASEERAARLRSRLETLAAGASAFPFAREYAITLYQLGRPREALAAIDRELARATAYTARQRDQLLLLKGLVLGADEPGGRAALRELIRGGQSRRAMGVALHLLASARAGADETGGLHGFLDAMISRSEDHPLTAEFHFLRCQLALARGDAGAAKEDAKFLLERFPGMRRINEVFRLLAYAALRHEPPQYRTAADFLTRLKSETPAGARRREINRLIGDCYFLNDDYANAADFYLEARRSGFGESGGEGLFLRLITAEVRAGRLDRALRHIDEADFRGAAPMAERWRAEWNLVRELQARGELRRALKRVRLLSEGAGAQSVPAALDLRLRWLEAHLSLEAGDLEGVPARIDALLERLRSLPEATVPPREARLLLSESLLLKAGAQFENGSAEAAFETLERVRRDFPDSSAAERAYLIEADRLADAEDFAGAQKSLERLASNDPESELVPQALFEGALYAERRGPDHYSDAVRLLDRLAEQYPDHPLAYGARIRQGDLLRQMNDFAGARIVYENLINRYPEHARRYLAEMGRAEAMLALAQGEASSLEAAARVLERLVDLPGLPVDLQVEAGFKWGFALKKRGRASRAIEIFSMAMSRFLLENEQRADLGETGRYWMARTLLELGESLEARGEPREARRVYRKIVAYGLPGRRLAESRAAASGGPGNADA